MTASQAPRRNVASIGPTWMGKVEITLSCGHVWYVRVSDGHYQYGHPKTLRCDQCLSSPAPQEGEE